MKFKIGWVSKKPGIQKSTIFNELNYSNDLLPSGGNAPVPEEQFTSEKTNQRISTTKLPQISYSIE
jgi:hypothetical protein